MDLSNSDDANGVAAVAPGSAPFSFEGDYSLEKLVERAVRMARPHCYGKLPRWVAVRDVFGWGSTTSARLCQHFGVDPHEEIEGVYPQDEDYQSDESYHAFVEKMAGECTCTPEYTRPCDGLLAGGLCDGLHLDRDEEDAGDSEQNNQAEARHHD